MALPLTASVVTDRLKRGGAFDHRRVIEVERFYVRSEIGGKWQACRHASIDTPVHVSGEVAMVLPLAKAPQKTPQMAARVMWNYIRHLAAQQDVWLVDDDVPEELREGVNLMPLERAVAIHDAIALTRTPTIDAAVFLARHAHETAGQPRTAVGFERPMLVVHEPRATRHEGPGQPPPPGAVVRHVGPRDRRQP